MFLNQKLFEITKLDLRYSNLYKEESKAIRSIADEKPMVIKKISKGSVLQSGTNMKATT